MSRPDAKKRVRWSLRDRVVTLITVPGPGGVGDSRLGQGIRWNLASFAVIACAGMLMNITIANSYGAGVLGVFNVVLAVYIVGGQVAALGLQYSTLYHASILADDKRASAQATLTALLLAVALSIGVCAAIWLVRSLFVDDKALASGLASALPGLFLFPLNKILMAALNGGRRMRAFAAFNAGRYILIIGAIAIAAVTGVPGEHLPGCLSVAESLLFIGLLAANRTLLDSSTAAGVSAACVSTHFRFGSRGATGGLLVELNSRVDILILGAFSEASAIGIYSVGAIFAEGLFQLLAVMRSNLDPLLARFLAEKRHDDLRQLITWGKSLAYAAMIVAGIFGIAVYPLLVSILFRGSEFDESWPIFAILTCGLIISAGYVPFGGILQQGGRPAAQSSLSAVMVTLNVLGNLVLAPVYGPIGAACATASAQAMFPLVLRAMAWRSLSVRL